MNACLCHFKSNNRFSTIILSFRKIFFSNISFAHQEQLNLFQTLNHINKISILKMSDEKNFLSISGKQFSLPNEKNKM